MIILPGGMIGGAPALPASLVAVEQTFVVDASTHTVSGNNFGAKAKGRNVKWGLVTLSYFAASAVTVTSPSIAGVSASIVFQTRLNTVNGTTREFVVFTARIDDAEVADIVWSDNRTSNVSLSVAYAMNLNLGSLSDSTSDSGAGIANLSIDCPAGGGIYGYGMLGGGSPTASTFNNLTTQIGGTGGTTTAASVFATAKTALNVSYAPAPKPDRCEAIAVSFPYAL